jgi:anti-repressor protein
MGNIQVFNHPQFGDIRTTGTPDNPEFCAMDLCRALGYSNGRDAVAKHVDDDDVAKRDTTDSIGRTQQLTYVNESGMYSLVLGSKLESAKKFKHWVTSEVLPAIRKSGTYSVEQLSRKQLALMVVQAEEEKERLALENKQQADQLEEQKPKVTFADAIIGSNTYIIIRDLAKLIQQNGYEIGEKRLYQWLRDNKYLTLDNKPMQRYIEQGLFFIAEGTHSENGVMKAHMTTKVTPKGQQYFINKFIHN